MGSLVQRMRPLAMVVFIVPSAILAAMISVVFMSEGYASGAGEPIKITFSGGSAPHILFVTQKKSFMNHAVEEKDPDTGGKKYSALTHNVVELRGGASLKFYGKGKLDNGMSISARWENRTNWGMNTEGALDEEGLALSTMQESGNSWRISPTGSFGAIRIGNNDAAANSLRVGDSPVGVGGLGDTVAANDYSNLLLTPKGHDTGLPSFPDYADGGSKNIGYYSPGKYPFRVGISYSPWAKRGTGGEAVQNSVGLRYEPKIGDVTVSSSVGYSQLYAHRDYAFVQNWSFGGGLSYQKIALNARYRKLERPYADETLVKHPDWRRDGDVKAWQAGAAYKGDPYTIQIQYRTARWPGKSVKDGDDLVQKIELGQKYSLSPSSRMEATVAYTVVEKKICCEKTEERVGSVFEAGISYSTPPYIVQLQYMTSEKVNKNRDEGVDTFWRVRLSGRYIIGPNVRLEGAVFYADKRNGVSPLASFEEKAASWNAGLTVAMGLNVWF